MIGTNVRTPWTVPHKFTPSTHSQSFPLPSHAKGLQAPQDELERLLGIPLHHRHARLDDTLSLLGPGFSEGLARLDEEDKHRIVEALRSLAGLLGDSPRSPSETSVILEASQEDEEAPAGAGH